MNKQEQIEKMARIIAKRLCRNGHNGMHSKWIEEGDAQCYSRNNFAECIPITDTVDDLIKAGYINGADFVAHLQTADISDKEYPHLATALCFDETREELMDFVDKALQEYLKGE